jgi:hypothetical protein
VLVVVGLADRPDQVVAGLLAAAAGFGAYAAMLMVGGVLLALLATGAAGHCAGLDRCADDVEIERGLAGHDAAGGLADVGAIETEANAPDQLRQVLLAEAGVGAARTGCGTVEAVLDTAQERVAIKAARLRMGLDQFSNCHFLSFLLPAALSRRRSRLNGHLISLLSDSHPRTWSRRAAR